MSYNRKHVRLLILQTLAKSPQYIAHQEALLNALKDNGYIISRDYLYLELAWLEGIADAIVDKNSGGVHIITLTGDGLEIAEGIKSIPGIDCPPPQ